MESKTKHLEMIQGVVNRLALSSFHLKGWTVVLISALFALGAQGANPMFVYLAYFPAFAFWVLDGYFLWQERLFRKLYDRVRVLPEDQIDFSMNVSPVIAETPTWFRATISITLLVFHGTVTGAIVIVMVLMILSP